MNIQCIYIYCIHINIDVLTHVCWFFDMFFPDKIMFSLWYTYSYLYGCTYIYIFTYDMILRYNCICLLVFFRIYACIFLAVGPIIQFSQGRNLPEQTWLRPLGFGRFGFSGREIPVIFSPKGRWKKTQRDWRRWWQLIFVYFHPENWGRFPIWRYFSKGLVQPPTSWRFHSHWVLVWRHPVYLLSILGGSMAADGFPGIFPSMS